MRCHPERAARTNWFVRACLNIHKDREEKTPTNRVCQCHPKLAFGFFAELELC
ncbi:hypothetical protein KSU1_D0116 [Candidatus Jettenia caeni]|uniref:Uncharacterized protein n=1 Tax=Candidatus Jettenia caeni TaxID=247490 RepID=I3INY0_9BACT|nr:hypothetical protein KSU1_D0116 [Candidatus Jettenia caeni]